MMYNQTKTYLEWNMIYTLYYIGTYNIQLKYHVSVLSPYLTTLTFKLKTL